MSFAESGLRHRISGWGGAEVALREALTAVANHSADLRLPELVGGYPRNGSTPPLPYTESCRPHACRQRR